MKIQPKDAYLNFLLVVGILLSGTVSEAATYYVTKGGNDGNSCSQALSASSAKKTINSGVKCLSAGDKLYIKTGTYVESLYNVIPAGTSWGSPVTVAAFPNNDVIVKGVSGNSEVVNIGGSAKKYIILDGLVIDAINVNFHGIKIDSRNGTGAHHIRIKNSEIKNAQEGNGILTSVFSSYIELINLNIHHNALANTNPNGSFAYGAYIQGKNHLIEHCKIWANAAWGIHIYNGYNGAANNNIVRNNRIYGNGVLTEKQPGAGGIIVASGSGNMIYNNLVYNHQKGMGIRLGKTSKAFNNTIYNNRDMAIQLAYSGGSSEVRNNIFWANGTDAVLNHGTGTPSTSNNLTTNPNFVDVNGANFMIKSSSPAVNSGKNLSSIFDFDFVGQSSKRDSNFDIGAYEFKSGNVDNTPPVAPVNLRVAQN